MTTLKITIAVAAVSLVALTGCGTQDTVDKAEQQATTAKQQAQKQAGDRTLSPQAQTLLERGQGLAADIATTAKAYGKDEITRKRAMDRFDAYTQRADDLVSRGQALPSVEQGRSSLTSLLARVQSTAAAARSRMRSGASTATDSASLDALRKAAARTYDQVQDKVPAQTRRRVSKALARLGA